MILVERFINQLMTSNCYVVYDDVTKRCIVIDPGSKESSKEIAFIKSNDLALDFIIITHEHTDHNWGVNALNDYFKNAKLICSDICRKNVKNTNSAYFLFYYDDPDYVYDIKPADIIIDQNHLSISWNKGIINFIITPGHSAGSICIRIGEMLFTGDTIMPYKPYFSGRDSSEEDWKISIETINKNLPPTTMIYPGHGDVLSLEEWNNQTFE